MKISIALISLLIITLISCNKTPEIIVYEIPTIPNATPATNIINNSFVANWDASQNITEYEIELSKVMSFDSVLATKHSSELKTTFNGLVGNTTYYYRVKAINGDKFSIFSNIISVLTLPDPPIATAATNIGTSTFDANWILLPGITDYKLYVSTEDFPHDSTKNLPNYNGIIVNSNTYTVGGLFSLTKYYYSLKAIQGNSISPLSNVISCTTYN